MAGAVSLFVKDTSKASFFKNNITIFGSTKGNDYLLKNYINLNTEKQFFKSSNTEYVKTFLSHKFLKKTSILEIHNKIKQIKDLYKEKIFLYFYFVNDGSKEFLKRIFN